MLAHRLSNVADAADYYAGGMIVAGEIAALRLLEAPAELLTGDDAAFSQTTARLAEAARERFGADLGLAIGREPVNRESSDGPLPEICIALASRDGTTVKRTPYTGHAAILKSRAAKQALNLARLALLHKS